MKELKKQLREVIDDLCDPVAVEIEASTHEILIYSSKQEKPTTRIETDKIQITVILETRTINLPKGDRIEL